jgi:hypothetical protein
VEVCTDRAVLKLRILGANDRLILNAENDTTINAIMMSSCVASSRVQPWLPLSEARYKIENGANSFTSPLLFRVEAKGKFECDANSSVLPLLRFHVEHPRSSPLIQPEGLVEA